MVRRTIPQTSEGSPVSDLGQRLLDASYLEGDFVLRSGRRSKFYLDKYLFSTQPDLLRDIAAGIAEKLPAYEPFDLLAGPELGAVAIVAAVSLASGKPFVIVRKGAKGYGTDKAMEGKAEPGQRVVMVEDVVTSGGAALMAVDKLREAGLEVSTLICVVDREEGGRAQIEEKGLTLDPLFTAHVARRQEAGVGGHAGAAAPGTDDEGAGCTAARPLVVIPPAPLPAPRSLRGERLHGALEVSLEGLPVGAHGLRRDLVLVLALEEEEGDGGELLAVLLVGVLEGEARQPVDLDGAQLLHDHADGSEVMSWSTMPWSSDLICLTSDGLISRASSYTEVWMALT